MCSQTMLCLGLCLEAIDQRDECGLLLHKLNSSACGSSHYMNSPWRRVNHFKRPNDYHY